MSDRLCQSIFFGDLMVTTLSRAALCPGHLLPTLLPAAPEASAALLPSFREQRQELTTLTSCPMEQWLWAAGPHPPPHRASGTRGRGAGGAVVPCCPGAGVIQAG